MNLLIEDKKKDEALKFLAKIEFRINEDCQDWNY